MIRRSTLLWLIAAILVGCGLYQLKYEVQAKEERLARLNRQIQQEQEAIHVLAAEWAFLNRPDRLAELSKRHLELTPVEPAQFSKVAAIPEKSLVLVAADGEASTATAAAPVVKVATSAPAKPVVKPQTAPKPQVIEAKRSLGTIDTAQLRQVKSGGRDVVVIVDGALLATAQR